MEILLDFRVVYVSGDGAPMQGACSHFCGFGTLSLVKARPRGTVFLFEHYTSPSTTPHVGESGLFSFRHLFSRQCLVLHLVPRRLLPHSCSSSSSRAHRGTPRGQNM